MAPLSAQEKVAYEVVRALKGNVSGAAGENGPVLEIEEGAEIDGSVWESDWQRREVYSGVKVAHFDRRIGQAVL
jgi:hypothetical protein